MMKRSSKYNTKQGEAILSYLISLNGEHTTAAQIASYFEHNEPMGLATIYRHLNTFVQRGIVKKYTLDGTSGACYQYLLDEQVCNQIHLKCEECGEVLHLQCHKLESVPQHVYEEHAFQINPFRTVFYGKCSNCLGT